MKKASKNKYGTRLRAVKEVIQSGILPSGKKKEVAEVIPAYNTQGKEYKRILPPIRDQRKIDLQALDFAIQKIAPGNFPSFDGNVLKLNSIDITIKDGICRTKKLVFRFTDVKDLLKNLRTEGLLNCDPNQIFYIEVNYKKNVHNK